MDLRTYATNFHCANRHNTSVDWHDLKMVDYVDISNDDSSDDEPEAKRS